MFGRKKTHEEVEKPAAQPAPSATNPPKPAMPTATPLRPGINPSAQQGSPLSSSEHPSSLRPEIPRRGADLGAGAAR
ncbi:MAG: hypothetical protein KIT20_15545, partial [Alphaproteobacteria bacterium]|nr:hypothetical protein [Alphaproteobacteria bacterium]